MTIKKKQGRTYVNFNDINLETIALKFLQTSMYWKM